MVHALRFLLRVVFSLPLQYLVDTSKYMSKCAYSHTVVVLSALNAGRKPLMARVNMIDIGRFTSHTGVSCRQRRHDSAAKARDADSIIPEDTYIPPPPLSPPPPYVECNLAC